jgi:uncharacterized protein YdaU (DUF1376 family)
MPAISSGLTTQYESLMIDKQSLRRVLARSHFEKRELYVVLIIFFFKEKSGAEKKVSNQNLSSVSRTLYKRRDWTL